MYFPLQNCKQKRWMENVNILHSVWEKLLFPISIHVSKEKWRVWKNGSSFAPSPLPRPPPEKTNPHYS